MVKKKGKRKGKQKEGPSLRYKMRDVSWIKPEAFQDHFTIHEVAREVNKDPTWIRRLEARGRLPKAARVQVGKLAVRLWSPDQVTEIAEIFENMKEGYPKGRPRTK
jgi:hypothetical protein